MSPADRLATAAALAAVLAGPHAAGAQMRPHDARFWTAAAVTLAGAAAGDPWLRRELGRPGPPLERTLARTVEPLGRSRTALLGLGASFALATVGDQPGWAHATARVAAGYLAADALTAALKPAVGRARPAVGAGPHAFHAFARDEAHHAFPSGHATHAFALAAGIADEAHRPWATAAAYGAATAVGWSRVHDDAHWTSDVVAGAVAGTAASLTTRAWVARWLARRHARRGS